MSDLTNILRAMERGEPQAADQLLPLVYEELRQLAAMKLAHEQPGQTLQPTALVHEAWLRLNGASPRNNPSPLTPLPGGERGTDAVNLKQASGDSRRYFFAAAGEAMRRILIDQARRKKAEMHGGQMKRVELESEQAIVFDKTNDLLAIHEVLDRLHEHDSSVAELVKLRYFVGMTIPEAAQALDISPRTADDWWAYARAWLRDSLAEK